MEKYHNGFTIPKSERNLYDIKRRTNIFLYVYIYGCSTKNVDVPREIYYAIELFPENENNLRVSRGEEKRLLLMMFSRCNHVYVYIYIPDICNQ